MKQIDKSNVNWWPFLLIAIAVATIWIIALVLLKDWPDRGTFGDMFGSVNALFSGLAFAGIIYAIVLQRQDLRLQSDELRLSRQELAGQREELGKQASVLRKQNFENTFFQLLRLHSETVNMMDVYVSKRRDKSVKGRECFEELCRKLQGDWAAAQREMPDSSELEKINWMYLQFYRTNQNDLGHYFRSLYNIVKFVDRSEIGDKKFYTNLLRAQLSAYELVLLFYNCLSDMGSDKFKPLVERYTLLKSTPKDLLLNPDDHWALYPQTAYQAK